MPARQPGIWIIDAGGITVYANERMAAILRVGVSEMQGKSSFEYVEKEDLPAAQALFEAKRRHDANSFRFNLRRKDGSRVAVNVQGTPMHDSAGNFMGITGTFTPVHEDEAP